MEPLPATADGDAPHVGRLSAAPTTLLRARIDDAIRDANRTVSRAESIGRYATRSLTSP